jgi:hypothetical protein
LPFNAALCNEATTDGNDPGPGARALVQRVSQVHGGYTRRAAHKLFDFIRQIIHPARLAAARRPARAPGLALALPQAQKAPRPEKPRGSEDHSHRSSITTEDSMRQPDNNIILHAVIAALPDDRLRPLLLELLGVVSAAPSADADGHKPADAVVTTTPAPPAKHAGGRPRGSRNKPKVAATGAKKAAQLAAQPGRESIVRAVANGELTQAAGARQIGCTAKTLGTWVVRYRSEHKPAATPTDGESAAAHAPAGAREPAPQAAKPAPAKRLSGPAGETPAQRAERLAKHAARQRERDAERRQQRDAERAAQAAQMRLPISGNGNGEDAPRSPISATRPAKPNDVDPAAEAALAAKLWRHAAALDPVSPWRPIVREFGINSAVAVDLYRSGSLPPIAPAAATRFCLIAQT